MDWKRQRMIKIVIEKNMSMKFSINLQAQKNSHQHDYFSIT